MILEVKGDNMLDDPNVKAKKAAAVESAMKYEILAGSEIMKGHGI